MAKNTALPLARFNVLDLTRARAGPTCVRQRVDWGAHAIKIEMPGGRTGDGMGGNRHGFDFQNLHRNKRSLTLNLRDPEGVAIFKKLAQDADIVVENYRPGVKERLGIDYKTLRAINPRLIYGSISGFGQSGPYRDRPGVDQIAQGMGGLMSITGIPGQGPVRVGIPIADLCSGIFLAQGILVALIERETNRDTIMEVLMPVTRQKPSAEWIRILNDAGVPCGPIYKINESFADPQVQHLAMAQPVHSPVLGDLTILGHPVSHGEKRLPLRSAAPELGEANEETLTSIGYSKEQIADLAKRGVI